MKTSVAGGKSRKDGSLLAPTLPILAYSDLRQPHVISAIRKTKSAIVHAHDQK
jgi:hypothetical protein